MILNQVTGGGLKVIGETKHGLCGEDILKGQFIKLVSQKFPVTPTVTKFNTTQGNSVGAPNYLYFVQGKIIAIQNPYSAGAVNYATTNATLLSVKDGVLKQDASVVFPADDYLSNGLVFFDKYLVTFREGTQSKGSVTRKSAIRVYSVNVNQNSISLVKKIELDDYPIFGGGTDGIVKYGDNKFIIPHIGTYDASDTNKKYTAMICAEIDSSGNITLGNNNILYTDVAESSLSLGVNTNGVGLFTTRRSGQGYVNSIHIDDSTKSIEVFNSTGVSAGFDIEGCGIAISDDGYSFAILTDGYGPPYPGDTSGCHLTYFSCKYQDGSLLSPVKGKDTQIQTVACLSNRIVCDGNFFYGVVNRWYYTDRSQMYAGYIEGNFSGDSYVLTTNFTRIFNGASYTSQYICRAFNGVVMGAEDFTDTASVKNYISILTVGDIFDASPVGEMLVYVAHENPNGVAITSGSYGDSVNYIVPQ